MAAIPSPRGPVRGRELIETWRIHNRINLYLLDTITPEALSVAPAKGRSAGELIAHMHNVG